MEAAKKFSFGPSLVDATGKIITPEVEHAREQGYEAGFEAGLAQARGELEADLAAMVTVLNVRLSEISARQQEAYAFVTGSTVMLVKSVLRKIIPHAISKYGDEELLSFTEEALKGLKTRGDLTVWVHKDLESAVQKLVSEECDHTDLTIHVKADESLAKSDCRIQWEDGGVESLRSQLVQNVDAVLDKFIQHEPSPPVPVIEEQKPSEGEENV